jgi:hypothetical protein
MRVYAAEGRRQAELVAGEMRRLHGTPWRCAKDGAMSAVSGYAAAFDLYHHRGWSVLPFNPGTKWPPPKGWTGRGGAMPSYADMRAWADNGHRDGNLAIRLPRTVIGIDVDNWGDKNGAATFAEAVNRWGKLPPTYYSTARSDGSCIRLFRIPEGEMVEHIGFPELGLGGIEICQHHHRYVMCWPSINPDADGAPYRWTAEIDGSVMDGPPALADIPELPAPWVEALSTPMHNGADLGSEGAVGVGGCLTEGEPSQRVRDKLSGALIDVFGSDCRHDAIRDKVLGLLRCGKNGEPGVKQALNALCEAFVNRVGKDRKGGRDEARGEFKDFVYGDKVPTLLADPEYDDEPEAENSKAETNGSASDSGDWKPGEDNEPTTWEPLDLGPYLRGEITQPRPEVGIERSDGLRLIYPGREHAILGETESGKTWLALGCVAAELLAGYRVLYIHYEEPDATSTIERLRLLGVSDTVIDARLTFVAPMRPVHKEWLAELLAAAPSLVVHDGVNEAMSLHGNEIKDADGAATFRRNLIRPCVAIGAATLACDHMPLAADGSRRDAYGSVHKGNALDGARIMLENVEPFGRGMRGVSYVFVTKDRPGYLRAQGRPTKTPGKTFMGVLVVDDSEVFHPFEMPFYAPRDDDSATALMDAAVANAVSGLRETVWEVIAAQPDRTVVSLRRLFAEMRNAGHQAREAMIRDTVDDLLVAGRLTEVAGRRGATGYQAKLTAAQGEDSK